jgi:hypothetical protein
VLTACRSRLRGQRPLQSGAGPGVVGLETEKFLLVKNGLTEIASLLLRKGQVREDGGIFRQGLRRTADKRYSLVMRPSRA